ncbi:MAG: (2Fe-2S) ferredoxin domain-containing protein [Chroococcidiopsidaceae cyanobacterium CP_BM_ER_R8_30]|nr:(2Fe-2S) ferredoxin domain-containing protein [Chroococcidiopsidaceae cyanobacterium CP_BM_ER_R8_30]
MQKEVMGNSANLNKQAIFVCQNEFCLEKGAEGYVEKLRQKMDEHGADVKVCPYICFNGCDYGPIIISYPSCKWYAGVTEDDLDTIIADTFSNQPENPEIERLQDNALDIDPDVRDATVFALKRKIPT